MYKVKKKSKDILETYKCRNEMRKTVNVMGAST